MNPSPWTNQAAAPSNSRDRGMADTYHILTVLRVPECARTPLAVNLATGTGGTPMMVSNGAVYTKQFDLLPVMDMSFQQGGVDYADRVFVAVDAPFVGAAYTYRCDGYYGAVAYMPKCQNLAVLEVPDPAVRDAGGYTAYTVGGIPGLTNFNDYWGRDGTTDGGGGSGATVPAPGTAALLVLGLLVAWLRRSKCPRS